MTTARVRSGGLGAVVAGAAFLALSGCTHAVVSERDYFAAYTPQGDTNFYRVDITARARNAETKYRAGKFPANAVDAVFGEVDATTDPQAEHDSLVKGVTATAKRYSAALASSESTPAQIEDAQRKYDQALSAIAQFRERSKSQSFDQSSKFVFVLSADPSRVIEAIRSHLDTQNLSNALVGIFQSGLVKDSLLIKEEFADDARRQAWRSTVVGAAVDASKTELSLPEAPEAVSPARLRELAARSSQVAGSVESALSSAEGD